MKKTRLPLPTNLPNNLPMKSHAPSQHSPRPRIVCVGYGNMAYAMLKGITESKLFEDHEILIVGRDLQKAQSLCATLTHPYLEALDSHAPIAIEDCVLLLCVKPHAFGAFGYVGKAKIAYSVMAGVRVDTIAKVLQAECFVRCMPNIGALYAKSASCVYVRGILTDDTKSVVRRLTESFGNCVIVDSEALIDASIATSGSAPAFLCVVAQSLIDSGVYHGLSHTQSRELVAQTFSGFAALLAHKSPDEIKTAITSPGGTSARGLAVLEKSGVRGAFIEAGIESIKRAKELGDT